MNDRFQDLYPRDVTLQPLLLHSMAHAWEFIEPVMRLVDPQHICEIGAESGLTTDLLCRAFPAANVWAVDPYPSRTLDLVNARYSNSHLVRAYSPEALLELPLADIYLVDGDHNYYTVLQELRTIESLSLAEPAPRQPLVILHDVGWPCARRDFYCDPERVPNDYRQPMVKGAGVVPGKQEAVLSRARGEEIGFRRECWVASAEGGSSNGVLTAVEDFLAEREGYEFLRVPVVFGFGFLFPKAAPYAAAVRAVVKPWAENGFLERLERNRIDLYLRVLELQDEVERLRALHFRA